MTEIARFSTYDWLEGGHLAISLATVGVMVEREDEKCEVVVAESSTKSESIHRCRSRLCPQVPRTLASVNFEFCGLEALLCIPFWTEP